jgi:hypothetical protein
LDGRMNRSRWVALGFLVLFIIVILVVPAWMERTGHTLHRSTDSRYAAFVLLCMGLVCIWWSDAVSHTSEDETPDTPGRGRRPMSIKSVGWLFLVLSIVIATTDLIR